MACNPVFFSLDRNDQAVPADEGDAWNTSTLKRGAGTGGGTGGRGVLEHFLVAR
ncbi:MAG: hypothetical protein H8E44_10695 [Planctomycetes bacterium]|nr:hypothetical protein [Planctomycetota bacterium]MBL7040400.1 hypothetical protein [Pirellulaceae bacterium]